MKKTLYIFVIFFVIQQLAITNNKLFGQSCIKAQTGYYINNTSYNFTDEYCEINGLFMSYWSCCDTSDALKFAVFDSLCNPLYSQGSTGQPYFGQYGEYHCQTYATPVFDFFIDNTDSTQKIITDFINSIPQNDYVLVMSHKNHHCQEWNDSLINAFRSIGCIVDTGATGYRMNDNSPYIQFGTKGAVPGGINYQIGVPFGNLILLIDTLRCNSTYSIMERNNTHVISIFPNPTTDNITIIIPKNATMYILNIQGQIIMQQQIQQGKTNIDVSRLAKGVYILKSSNNESTEVMRFVKE